MSDYEEKANKFLEAHGISFKAIYISDDCPDWCDDSHIHGDKYEASFSREGREDLKLFFWNSYHDKMKGISPVAYDVLAAITKTDPGSFEDFCDELGYDSDSRKRSEERRVGKECRSRVSPYHEKKYENTICEVVCDVYE